MRGRQGARMQQRRKKEDKEFEGQGNCAMGGAMGGVCRANKFDT
jgi:hypothetical protein